MPTKGSITKTARITGEDWEEIERSGKTFSRWVHENVGTPHGNTSFSQSDALKDLESMMKCFHANLDDGIRAFQRGLEDGSLTYENGRVRANEERGTGLDDRDFLEACEAKGKDPQEVLDRYTRMVWSM